MPLEELPRFEMRRFMTNEVSRVAFLRCQIEVTTPGKVKLGLNSALGLGLWIDQVPRDLTRLWRKVRGVARRGPRTEDAK